MSELLDRLVAEHDARVKEAADADRAEWIAEHPDGEVPELEFLPPDCSICGLPTDYDDGAFYCAECEASWDRFGRNGSRG